MESSSTSLNEEELSNVFTAAYLAYSSSPWKEEKRQALLQFLQNNDCRRIIAKCVDGDDLSRTLTYAGFKDHVDILQAFLDQGINVDVKDQFGCTALIWASRSSSNGSTRLLLEKYSNPNATDNNGFTALMYASEYGHKEIVQLLLNHNADVDFKDNDGWTAHDLARNEEIKEMIQNHVNTSYILK